MTYDPTSSDPAQGLLVQAWEGDPSFSGRMTRLLIALYNEGQDEGWDEVRVAKWDAYAHCLSMTTCYTPEQIEAQIAYLVANPKTPAKSPVKKKIIRKAKTA